MGPSHRRDSPTALALAWLPVLATLGLFAQVCLLGLRPSLAESRRLAGAEARLGGRYGESLERRDQLERMLRAQADPIYLERELKLLRVPGSPLRGD